ncbi:hypothetical protein [Silvibacterium dinghuense]|uniref:WD40 repeat protein n=1 Tax=Silvibacterium dinghuense TaxID=1560006 RepID=A0A4Q1S9G8_9BACT|nr:hypothetical protein [Silvibacterium dinghuense]RXS93690.1 hypothetical protein ESZ00_16660 [Silvibacterium dinghuense]GGH06825.1 hypothetical protein GCM10011586_23770 [Silvibacterium dinghuense]
MSIRRVLCLLLTLLCPAVAASAEKSFWQSKDAYLRQPHPSSTPRPFAPALLRQGNLFGMGRVAFSADGREFYYALNDSWISGVHAQLRCLRFTGHAPDHGWSQDILIGEQFLSPTLSADGNTLSMRHIVPHGSMNNVWESHRTASGWSAPAPFLEESFGVYDYMPTRSGNAYVGSEPDADDKAHGIDYAYSVLTFSGNQPQVRSLGRPVNEPGFNGDLYIAPDESYLIVSAKETPTYQSQLYIAFHRRDGSWTTPVSLGEKINRGLAHRWGQYVSPDGKYLFYCHGTSEKDCAIYWVRFDTLLAKLRPKNL